MLKQDEVTQLLDGFPVDLMIIIGSITDGIDLDIWRTDRLR